MPNPLHPAMVHLPLGLALVLPFLAAALVWAIAKGHLPGKAWWLVVGLQALVLVSVFVAMQTGEASEEAVERIVDGRLIHEHELAAQFFLGSAALTTLLALAGGFAPERFRKAARIATTVAALHGLTVALRTGHLGGELVYRHGAAAAFTTK